jgi:hypothetical protein
MMRIRARLARISHLPGRGSCPRPGNANASRVLALFGLMLSVGVAACADQGATGGALTDQVPPTVMVTAGTAPSDTTIAFDVAAVDNLGLKNIQVTVSGPGITGTFDTTFTSAVTSVTLPYTVAVPSSVPPGTTVIVVATAIDGMNNTSKPDTAYVGTGNLPPSVAVITNPTSADTGVVGFAMAVSISGKSPSKVRALGFIATGVFASPVVDSVLFSSPLKDSTAVDTAISLTGATQGTMTLTPFVMDSLNRRFLGAPVNVTVLQSAGTNTVPTVDFGLTSRIEVTDTIHVKATDLAGIRWLGYEIRNLPSDPATFFGADSFQVSGNVNSALHTFQMKLNITSFPKDVEVRAFATNTNGRRQYALLSGGAIRADTVKVVAGLTRGVPNGGVIADALYHQPTDRLYLTNIERNELEVFDLSDSTFKTPIITGSRPWGIAAWPRDRNGTMTDTLLVANSGGTNISEINVATGQEFSRYPLPNIVAYSVSSTIGPAGVPIQQLTPYDFSDRPQYLATTCKGPAVGPAPCGDMILVYSTTPTRGQNKPFDNNNGTVRWENMVTHESHFFFEQAEGQTQGRSDTLRIDKFAAQGIGSDSVLVPFIQKTIVGTDTLLFSVVVQVPFLGFRDTTFVRNSGNFRRAIIGEGGAVAGSRAIMYDVTQGMEPDFPGTTTPLPVPVFDQGISRPVDVSDFIANTFARIGGAAINFDGELAAIRGDSTYIIDRTLRLQGLLQTSGGNAGFDFHPSNAGVGPSTSPAGTRLSFAASTQPQIEVYDTYTYRRCLILPTRDPIIGPIKSAIRSGTNDVVLVGATISGVVVVTVTQAQLTGCQ